MNTSEQLNELAAALAKAQGMMDNAVMNRINPHFKSKYADLAALFDAARAPLSANGLSIVQTIGNGILHTRLLHTSGQWIASEYSLPTSGRPQEIGSALTYARRYSLAALIGIAADEDDDANAAEKVKVPLREVINKQTGEITETAAPAAASSGAVDAAPPEDTPEDGAALSLLDKARKAARGGTKVFRPYWRSLDTDEREQVTTIGDELAELRKAADTADRKAEEGSKNG